MLQSSTKAAVRACRNAIEFNSIPSIKRLIPDVSHWIVFWYFAYTSHHDIWYAQIMIGWIWRT